MKEQQIIMPNGWPHRRVIYCPLEKCQHAAAACVARMIQGRTGCGTSRRCEAKNHWSRYKVRKLNGHPT